MGPIVLVHLGDERHGVDRYAREVAGEAALALGRDCSSLPEALPSGVPVHLHYTDRLWGRSPEESAEAVERIARRGPVSVTLHDLPQASDGPASQLRRGAAYRRVVACATHVVCNSAHELGLLRALRPEPVPTSIVPLPCDVVDEPGAAATRSEVAIVGFFYPGKGHDEAVAAAARSRSPLPVVALGAASPGHEGDLAAWVDRARALGVRASATGFLPEPELQARMRAARVPVVAHRHVSASGSLNAWIGAGRRPIVVRNAYFEEMAALRPGTAWLVGEDELADAVEAAAADPSLTLLAPDASTGPGLADVAAAYVHLWRTL